MTTTSCASAERRRRLGRLGRLGLVALCGLSLSACTAEEQQGSPSHRMDVWVTGGSDFGQDVATLHADNDRITAVVAQHHGTGAIRADCDLLTNDAEAANDELPTPDEKVSTLLYDGYGLEGQAGIDCYNAGSADRALLSKSAGERARGWALIIEAFERVESITGGPVPTTTTSSPSGGSIFG